VRRLAPADDGGSVGLMLREATGGRSAYAFGGGGGDRHRPDSFGGDTCPSAGATGTGFEDGFPTGAGRGAAGTAVAGGVGSGATPPWGLAMAGGGMRDMGRGTSNVMILERGGDRMWRKLWALAISFSVACGGTDGERVEIGSTKEIRLAPVPLTIEAPWLVVLDPNVGPLETAQIRSALTSWHDRIPCSTEFSISVGETVPDDRLPLHFRTIDVRMGDPTIPSRDPIAAAWTNWDERDGQGALIVFGTLGGDPDFARVARHELGHAFWLQHDDSEPSIMQARQPFVGDVTEADGRNYAQKWCP
jgi:hypothetical protein